MVEKKELAKFVSEFWKIDVSKVTDTLPLDDKNLQNNSSIRFYQFIAAVESNFDVEIKEINKILTFGDLYKSVKS